jgi:tetratricopeptide (TPR) repeat protein
MADPATTAAAQARALLAVGRPAEAIQILRWAIGQDPQKTELRSLLAECLLRIGDVRGAANTAREAIALDPEDAWPHRIYSLALREMGKRRHALAAAREAVRLAPAEPIGYYVLGRLQLESRKFDDADRSADEAARLTPHALEGHLLKADVARGRRRWKEAEALYRRALSIEPANWVVVNNYALVLKHLGRQREAIAAFENAARLNPRAELPRNNLFRHARDFLIDRPLYFGLAAATFFVVIALRTWLRDRWDASDPWLVGGMYVYLGVVLGAVFLSEQRRKRKLSATTQLFYAVQARRLLGKGSYRFVYFMVAFLLLLAGVGLWILTDAAAYVFIGIVVMMAWVIAWPIFWRRRIRDWAQSRGWG